jgi:hypothetical protein
MSRPFDFYEPPELAYHRRVLFAIEVLDAVTLERVTQGLKVTAMGLKGLPVVNAGGLFVWLKEDLNALQKVTIGPGALPFESLEIPAAELKIPLSIVELSPRSGYPFPAGITAIRGTLIEERVAPPDHPQPVQDAGVRLMWLDDDGTTWHDSPVRSHTNVQGDFATILRFAPDEVPRVSANGALTVRLRAKRTGQGELRTAAFALPRGRIADNTYAWNELQP